MSENRIQIMELSFSNLTMEQAVETAMEHMRQGTRCRVVTPNAEHGMAAKKNKQFRDIINSSQLVLPDGISVVYAAKILGKKIKQKVAGIEFGENLCKAMANTGKSIFFFGAKPGVAKQAADKLCAKYPGLLVAGTRDGYFTDEQAVVDEINAAKPDAVLVCLGAPKQELFMDKYDKELTCSVMAGLGGSIDGYAGLVSRAPKLFIKLGLEWFYRLIKDPKRIKRMAKLPIYLWDALIWRLGGKNHA